MSIGQPPCPLVHSYSPTSALAALTTHRDTDTQTHRHTDTQTHRHTDTQTHRHTDRHRQTQTHIHTRAEQTNSLSKKGKF